MLILNVQIFFFIVFYFSCFISLSHSLKNVIWAVNCGGDAHVDSNGIKYQKDNNVQGIASDYGKNMIINRLAMEDQIVYQTERYNTASFGYEVPIPSDGDYVLVLKFSEVWFTAPNQKVFDVMLNGDHTVVHRLDIFNKVGRGTAHDEIVPFRVKDGKLYVKEGSSDLYYNKILVEFIKGDSDNPKINGIVLMKGSINDVPRLLPLTFPEDQNPDDEGDREHQAQHQQQGGQHQQQHSLHMEDGDGDSPGERQRRKKLTSGPKSPDPYSTDDTSSMFFPLVVAIGAFLPILFCLCKL